MATACKNNITFLVAEKYIPVALGILIVCALVETIASLSFGFAYLQIGSFETEKITENEDDTHVVVYATSRKAGILICNIYSIIVI